MEEASQSTEGSGTIAHLISEGAVSGVRLEEGHRGTPGRRPEEKTESSTAGQIQQQGISIKKKENLVFLGGPVVKTPASNGGCAVWIPGWGTKLQHASWPKIQTNAKKKKKRVFFFFF